MGGGEGLLFPKVHAAVNNRIQEDALMDVFAIGINNVRPQSLMLHAGNPTPKSHSFQPSHSCLRSGPPLIQTVPIKPLASPCQRLRCRSGAPSNFPEPR